MKSSEAPINIGVSVYGFHPGVSFYICFDVKYYRGKKTILNLKSVYYWTNISKGVLYPRLSHASSHAILTDIFPSGRPAGFKVNV